MESKDTTGPDELAAEAGGIPWVDAEVQQRVAWRDGDIVVSVAAKSGTTWSMNIVHQLRSGGDRAFSDIYVEVPWLEFVDRPDRTRDELVARIDSMPDQRRRAFKTHSSPPVLPFVAPDSGTDVRYLVVARNPEEAAVSLKPFIEKHSDAFFDLWQVPRGELTRPTFAEFYHEVMVPQEMYAMFAGFLAGWWPLRDQPNVLLMHFSEMKRDHEGSIRRIADFLGFSPSEAEWPTILECTSFSWMKEHQRKFELSEVAPVPVLESGAMVRKGKVGAAAEDGMTEEIARDLAARVREFLGDEAAFEWLYKGGELP